MKKLLWQGAMLALALGPFVPRTAEADTNKYVYACTPEGYICYWGDCGPMNCC